ncbi:MAG: hypothetical protein COA45_01585 [Zetaproteobacteria bacterium]|nr:MAG: hypothetical protein COA45_01585 [Zetaproteobacteria bacterium]
MGETLFLDAFKGTNIKTPFEIMRARSIIHAEINTRGLSLIGFNLTTFMAKGREKDAYFILSLWAVEPISHHVQTFRQNPTIGQQALIKRAKKLIMHLEKRSDTSEKFLDTALQQMTENIDHEIKSIIREKHYSAG